MSGVHLAGGFTAPAEQAARAFRVLLDAMARPGRILTLDTAAGPAPLSAASSTALLVLCDPDTPLWLARSVDTPTIRDWIAFHTGAPAASDPAHAQFVVGPWAELMPLDQYAIGTPDYPDRSATLIAELPALTPAGPDLSGPGIAGRSSLSLPDPELLARNAAQFPLGCDFLFTCGDRIAALPRSTRLHLRGAA